MSPSHQQRRQATRNRIDVGQSVGSMLPIVLMVLAGLAGCQKRDPQTSTSKVPAKSSTALPAKSAVAKSVKSSKSSSSGPQEATLDPKLLPAEQRQEGWVMLWDGQTTFGWSPVVDASMLKAWDQSSMKSPLFRNGFWHLEPGDKPARILHHAVWHQMKLQIKYQTENVEDNPVKLEWFVPNMPSSPGDDAGSKRESDQEPSAKASAAPTGSLALPASPDKPSIITLTIADGKILLDGKPIDASASQGRRPDDFQLGFLVPKGSKLQIHQVLALPLGMSDLFNQEDLTGWKRVPKKKRAKDELEEDWTVRKGLLHVEVPAKDGLTKGGRGYLETEKQFGNFWMQVRGRTNGPEFNSGIFFRGEPGLEGIGYEAQIHHGFKDGDRTQPKDFGTGGIYRRIPARYIVGNDNTFFTMSVMAYQKRFMTWVDGYPTADWTDPRAPSVNPRKGYREKPGTLSIQSHDPTTNLDFQSIKASAFGD